MTELIILALYLIIMAILLKSRIAGHFRGTAAFVTGMVQAILLFVVFFLIFRGTAADVMMIDSLRLTRILSIDMMTVLFYITFVFFHIRKNTTKLEFRNEAMALIQVFLPALLLNVSLILLIRFDTAFNQSFYMSIIIRYFSILFFKMMFVIAGMLVINYSREGNDNESGKTS